MNQAGVRLFLAAMFLGVLYVFGSLAVMVNTAHTYCDHRPAIGGYAVLGIALLLCMLLLVRALSRGGSLLFVLPGTFYVLGLGIPVWLSWHSLAACAVHAGK